MYEYRAVVRSVHDGDSLRADIDLGFGIWTSNQALRLHGLDAPELGTAGGRVARDYLRSVLPAGQPVVIHTIKDQDDKYGRLLAIITVDDGDPTTADCHPDHTRSNDRSPGRDRSSHHDQQRDTDGGAHRDTDRRTHRDRGRDGWGDRAVNEGQAQAHWAVYGNDHRPIPDPLYWDWRCLVCDGPVDDHPGLIERWRRRRRRCSTCGQRMSTPPCSRSPITGKGGHTYGGGVSSA